MNQEEIRKAMRFLNLNELARETGISYVTLWRISKGKGNANASTLKTISKTIKSITKGDENE